MSRAEAGADRRHLPTWFLVLTAVLCGGLIMVLEVLGSRVIGPFFGVSLFIWTSLIAVTLIALSIGYWLGGVLADRYRDASVLYLLVALAGVLTLLIPLAKAPVLMASMELGLRWGSFVSATVLFGPSLLVLGCVSPFVVRLAVHNMERLGRTVGRFYALSTLGSVLGTLATGFVLIAYLGINGIIHGIGIALLVLAASYFLLFRRRPAALLLLLPSLLAARGEALPPPQTLADGTRVTQIAAYHSYYGNLKVLEYRYGQQATRELIIDGLVQGGVDPADGRSVYEYAYLLGLLPSALYPDGRDCLVIGLGAGVTPKWYEQRGITCDVVDIDPAVVRFARDYFGFSTAGEVHVEDARYFLQTHPRRYDYLIVDVFTGDTTPAHLLSREALALAAQRLSPEGVFAANLVGGLHGEDAYMTASIVRTLETVFDQVELVPVFDPATGQGRGNMVVLAYRGAPRQAKFTPAWTDSIHPLARQLVSTSLERRWRFPDSTPALLLTDDFNPIDFHDADLRESVRRSILATTPPQLLLDG